jgi:chorismate mutase/prephenate dehydratase
VSVDDVRQRIDAIDDELVELLNKRIAAAIEIGKLKQDSAGEVYVPAREKAVLEGAIERNSGPITDDALKAVYREIMSASLALEKEVRVAYLGPAATFTHYAARSRFGTSVEYIACETVGDVFASVEKGNADYGVVPIENSIHGPEAPTLDCFVDTGLKICAEIILPISQCLLSRAPRERVKRVYSHPQAFAQCRGWMRMEMPGVEQVSTTSTAKAAELAAQEDGSAAIASALAAEMYKLDVVAESIQDVSGNKTRFMVLANSCGAPTGDDKTSIIFSVKHAAGSLYNALESFREYGLNMTKIESRPSKSKAWEYCFFVDFEGHSDDEPIAKALADLSTHCVFATVLGSYPKAL